MKGKFLNPNASVAGAENPMASLQRMIKVAKSPSDEERNKVGFPTFEGTAQLDNLKLNKLELAPKLTGKVFAGHRWFIALGERQIESLSAEISADGKASAALRRGALRAG